VALQGGEQDLVDFLIERVRAHGGEAHLGERAARIVQRNGRIAGVVIDADDEPIGVDFVVTGNGTRLLLDLTSDFDPPRRSIAALPRLVPAEWRFVVSMVVLQDGLPAALGEEAFLLPEWPHRGKTPAKAPVHLQRRREPCGIEGATLLVAEAAFPVGTSLPVAQAREAVLAVVESLLPYIERHYLVVDSPNDGRPLWDFRSGRRVDIDRTGLRPTGGSLEPEPMAASWHIDPPGFHNIGAEPIRAPLAGAFVVGPSTLPALGQEGELLAAWSAARLVTRTDRRRERMRREMWNKIELR
jgi:hypothetical protein